MPTNQPPDQLVVRQHERLQCRLPAHARIAQEHADQVAFARSVGDGSGAIDVFITDCSRGGINIESAVFIPRGCRLRVSLAPDPTSSAPPVELTVRVQRPTMIARAPVYALGASFVGQGEVHEAMVVAMIDAARRAPAKPLPKSGSEKGAA